jgi:hypothetical protein
MVVALAQKFENLLDYRQSQGQIRTGTAYSSKDPLDLDVDQTAAQLTADGQAVLGLSDIF